MLLIKLGLRNILRNKKRMGLAGIAICVGLAAMIVMDSYLLGLTENLITNATNTFSGSGQIHAKEFLTTFEAGNTIKKLDELLSKLGSEKLIKNFTLRTQTFSMLSSPYSVAAVVLFGIDPKKEKYVSIIDEAVIEGGFLENDQLNRLLIGKKLSELLDAGIGDRIVVTVAQAEGGELSQELFRVGGIFQLNIREMDKGIAFCHIKKSQELLGIGSNVHEVAFRFHNIENAEDPLLEFWEKYSVDGNEAVSWKDLIPGLEATLKVSKFSSLLMGVLLFAVVVLVVMNALFISLYERMYEFGVLRAIGTRPFYMAMMILVEASILALFSIAAGLVLGVAISYILSISGIDNSGLEFAQVTLREPTRPVITFSQLTFFAFCVFIFTLIAALLPARHAAKLTPAHAIKKMD